MTKFRLLVLLLLLSQGIASPCDGQSAFYVQVNTNALGQNILGDAGNEPSIAVDPTNPNRMAVGWRQFDNVASNFRQSGVAYTTNGGLTWTSSVLSPGSFGSDPVLESDGDGNFYYSSLSSSTSGGVYKSTDGGASWGAPVNAFLGDKQWMAIDKSNGPGRGHIYQHWNVQFANVANTSLSRSVDGNLSYQQPFLGPSPASKWGTLTVGQNGTLYAAGSTLNQTGHLFSKSSNAQFAGQTPTFTQTSINLGGVSGTGTPAVNPAGLLGQISIASASNGNLYVLGSINPTGADPQDVMFTRSTNDGATWSSPIRINNNPANENSYQWFGTMSVAPNGRIDAIWNDTGVDTSNNFSVLKYAYSLDEGLTWLGHISLTPSFNHLLGFPSQDKMGDYFDMESDDLGAHVAFSATLTGGQDVYYMRITAVPEPSTAMILLALGLGTLLTRRRENR